MRIGLTAFLLVITGFINPVFAHYPAAGLTDPAELEAFMDGSIEAIRSDQSIVDARINISHVYANGGEFVRASRHLRHGYEKTGNSSLLPMLSVYEARGGLLDDALLHLDEVIASGQAISDHWIYRSLILERKKMWGELKEHFRVMADQVPELRDWIDQKRGEPPVAAALSSSLSGPRSSVGQERSHEA